jgi:hypothetical protein
MRHTNFFLLLCKVSKPEWASDGRFTKKSYTIAIKERNESLELKGIFLRFHLAHEEEKKLIVFMKHKIFQLGALTEKGKKKIKKKCFLLAIFVHKIFIFFTTFCVVFLSFFFLCVPNKRNQICWMKRTK